PVREVHELLHQPAEQEVQLAQPHQRERVRREDQVGILGDPEYRRDGVDGEHEIGAADRDDHQQHRSDPTLTVTSDGDPLPHVVLGDGQHPTNPTDQGILTILVVIVSAAAHQTDRRPAEHGTEDEEHPHELADQRGPHGDEHAPQHERQYDTDQQDTVLVHRGNPERRDDHHEDEQVVRAQRVLGDVTGEELDTGSVTAQVPHPHTEQRGERHVETHPFGGLRGPHAVWFPIDDHQIEGDQPDESRDRHQPQPQRHRHTQPPDQRTTHHYLEVSSAGVSPADGAGFPRRTVLTTPPRGNTPLHGVPSVTRASRHARVGPDT